MIQKISVVHPLIDRMDHEPFWHLQGGRLSAKGGEYFGRCDTGGLPNEDFFNAMEGNPEAALQHAKSTFMLISSHLAQVNPSAEPRHFHAGNVSLSALAVAGADEQLLSCMETSHPCRPAVEVREVKNRISSKDMETIEQNVQGLSRTGVPILLDDIEDKDERDPRWAPLFRYVSAIKLAGSVTEKILRGGLDSLSAPARRMVDDAVQGGRKIVLEAVPDLASARHLSFCFNGFSRLLMQGYHLDGEKRMRERVEGYPCLAERRAFTAAP